MTLPLVTDCHDCGVCCDRQGTPPFSYLPGDRPPPELAWDRVAHADRYGLGLPCLWFDAGRCRHYELRPQACREFATGGGDCLEMRRERGV